VAESKVKYAVAGWLEEMARHPLSFKLAGGERLAEQRVEELARSYLDERDRHFRIVFRQLVGALTLEVVASVALLAIGGLLVIARQLSIGQLVAAELIVTAVVAAIAKLGGKVEVFYDLVAAVDKLGEILDLPLERPTGECPAPNAESGGHLLLRDVELDIGHESKPRQFSLTLGRGERMAITGASERVTTALADAIFGLHLPQSGVIEIDGHDVRDLALREVRSRIAIVRDTEILPGCILDNLRAANAELSSEDAWNVLRRVGLSQIVKTLPRGLETELLPSAAPLSRTQAMALTIARALAGKPSVLLIDRMLDRLPPVDRDRVINGLLSARDESILLISADPELLSRMDRQIDLGDAIAAQGEEAA
jgi:ABC-type bacteriocin/lantibiotic exporter with double-glycine peptidase domain